jgi:large subunit ribosomal protein L9
MIKILLLEEIHKVGNIGDIVSVKSGFARNFLIPTGRAMRATEEAIKRFAESKHELLRQREERLTATRALRDRLDRTRLIFFANSSPDGKLYGSIGATVMADEIVRHVPEAKDVLRKNQIRIPAGNIKQTGDFRIVVSFAKDIEADIMLTVSSDGKAGESLLGPMPETKPETSAEAKQEEASEQPPSDGGGREKAE